jgi:hypothetical protein
MPFKTNIIKPLQGLTSYYRSIPPVVTGGYSYIATFVALKTIPSEKKMYLSPIHKPTGYWDEPGTIDKP